MWNIFFSLNTCNKVFTLNTWSFSCRTKALRNVVGCVLAALCLFDLLMQCATLSTDIPILQAKILLCLISGQLLNFSFFLNPFKLHYLNPQPLNDTLSDFWTLFDKIKVLAKVHPTLRWRCPRWDSALTTPVGRYKALPFVKVWGLYMTGLREICPLHILKGCWWLSAKEGSIFPALISHQTETPIKNLRQQQCFSLCPLFNWEQSTLQAIDAVLG